MKAELDLPKELVESIANEVIEKLKPILHNAFLEGEEKILTIEELTDFLKVKKPQIYAWVYESKHTEDGIPFMKAGKFLRFSKRAVIEWMKRYKKLVEKR